MIECKHQYIRIKEYAYMCLNCGIVWVKHKFNSKEKMIVAESALQIQISDFNKSYIEIIF